MRNFTPIIYLSAWILVFFSFGVSVNAQNRNADSLRNVIQFSKSDTLKIKAMIRLAEELGDTEKESLPLCKQASELAEKAGHKKLSGIALHSIGLIYYFSEKYTEALEYFKKSMLVKVELEDSAAVSKSLNNIAVVYELMGDYTNSIKHHLQSIAIKEALNDSVGMSGSYNNIGLVYHFTGDENSAMFFLEKAFGMRKQINDSSGLAQTMNNMALVYSKTNKEEKALETLLEVAKIEKLMGKERKLATTYSNIGLSYKSFGKNKTSMEYFQKSLKIGEKFNEKEGVAASLINIGQMYITLSNYELAISSCKRSLDIGEMLGAKTRIAESCICLAEAYEKKRDYESAYIFYKRFSENKDSLFNENSAKQIVEMKTRYETEKKEIEIGKLSKEKELQQSELEKREAEVRSQNTQKTAFAGGFVLMIALAVVIFRSYKQKHKANELISSKKEEVEKQKDIVDEKNREILDSITYARRLQEAILPPQRLVKEYLENSFVLYKPKDIVAGDFYWIAPFNPPEGEKDRMTTPSFSGRVGEGLLFAVADCTGHGVPGALVSVVCSNALNRAVKEFGLKDPGKILDKVTELVVETFEKSENEVKDGMDIALVSLMFGVENKLPSLQGEGVGVRLKYAGANNPLWIIRNKELIEYKGDKQPIGSHMGVNPFTTHQINLLPGDTIYIFSDGYADQFGGSQGKKFKSSKMRGLLLSIQDKNTEEQRVIIDKTFEEWKGNLEQIDDVCMIGVRV